MMLTEYFRCSIFIHGYVKLTKEEILLCFAVLCSAVWYYSVLYSAVLCDAVNKILCLPKSSGYSAVHSAVLPSVVFWCAMLCSAGQCCAMWCSEVQHSAALCSAVRCSAVQCCAAYALQWSVVFSASVQCRTMLYGVVLAPVVQILDKPIHHINNYLHLYWIGFIQVYSVIPPFEQLGPVLHQWWAGLCCALLGFVVLWSHQCSNALL